MSDAKLRFGLVLPHFGARPAMARVLEVAQLAEKSGFDSLWVRDRLVAGAPHGLVLEAGGTTFFEPLLTLAAVAAVTDRIILGTAVLLPNRHPLRLLQELGTLSRLAPQRMILGLGLGVGPNNFESLGYEYESRRELYAETVAVLRGSLGEAGRSHAGAHFAFGNLEIDPVPDGQIPIYYGGVSRAAVRRAFEDGDGWIAGRLPRDTFRARMELFERFRSDTGRSLDIASMPITLVDAGDGRHAAAASEAVSLLAASAEGASDWIKPQSGRFESVEDLSGLLISGSSDQCVVEVASLIESGVRHVIFDLRLVFDDFEGQLGMLSEIIIPHFT